MILYNDKLLPSQFWTVITVLQYILPLIVLLQIKVPAKIWFYWLLYPLFMYSWIPVTFLGYLDRHKKDGCTPSTREASSFRTRPLPERKRSINDAYLPDQ